MQRSAPTTATNVASSIDDYLLLTIYISCLPLPFPSMPPCSCCCCCCCCSKRSAQISKLPVCVGVCLRACLYVRMLECECQIARSSLTWVRKGEGEGGMKRWLPMGVAFTSIEPDCRLKCRSPRTRMKSQLGVVAGREHGVAERKWGRGAGRGSSLALGELTQLRHLWQRSSDQL